MLKINQEKITKMADICEICIKQLKMYVDYDRLITYEEDEIILCRNCQEEVDELYNKHDGDKEFKKCVEEVRKRKRKNEK